jgi:hypothetical protein
MTFHSDCVTYFVKAPDGSIMVVICYENGCQIRPLDSKMTTSLYSLEHQNCGQAYWLNEALKKLGLTKFNIVCRCRGTVAFPD